MDDLSQQLNQILSDPQAMQQIQGLMGSLGLGQNGPSSGDAHPAPPSAPVPASQNQNQNGGLDPSALMGALNALGGLGGKGQEAPAPSSPLANLGGLDPQMLQMVGKLAPMLSQINREDDSTRLLHALRPLLGPARQKKLDEAIKILQMMRLLPLLKESGVFSGLLSGLL